MLEWKNEKQRVFHTVALKFTLKKYLKAKEELWKFKYFTMQKYDLQKNPSEETNNSITNLKFQHKPKHCLSQIFIQN